MAGWTDRLDCSVLPFVATVDGDAYPAQSFLAVTGSEAAELRRTSEALFPVLVKACMAAARSPAELLLRLGVPGNVIPFLGKSNALGLPSWISRMDFVRSVNGSFHMVEINADTPCAIPEAFYGNGIAAEAFGREDPNRGEYERLQEFLSCIDARTSAARKDVDGKLSFGQPFAFACFPSWEEDRANTLFLKRALDRHGSVSGTAFWDFSDIEVVEGMGLRAGGQYAHALYRLHPMEMLAEERGTEGEDLAGLLLKEWEEGRVHLMNPPDAIVLQSKPFLALVHALARAGSFFSVEERRAVLFGIPKSLLSEDAGMDAFRGFALEKPAYGREGGGIRLVRDAGERKESCLYQEFVESAPVRIEALRGPVTGYVTYSCFLLAGKASAIYARVSPDIVAGSEAYWVPLLH